MRGQYRPGEIAPFDGVYLVARLGDVLPTLRARFNRGDVFPNWGWMFYLDEPDPPTLRLVEDSDGNEAKEDLA